MLQSQAILEQVSRFVIHVFVPDALYHGLKDDVLIPLWISL